MRLRNRAGDTGAGGSRAHGDAHWIIIEYEGPTRISGWERQAPGRALSQGLGLPRLRTIHHMVRCSLI